MFDELDIQQIEDFAKIIFVRNRTLASLTNLEKTSEFKKMMKLFSKITQSQGEIYNNNYKIHLIFSEYLYGSTTTGSAIEMADKKYAKKNMTFLRNQAMLIEKQILNIQEIPVNISEYISSLLELEKIHEIITNNESIDLDCIYESKDFPTSILEFEKKINYLKLSLSNAKINFLNYDENKSVYLKNNAKHLNLATKSMELKINEHLIFLANKIKQKSAPEDLKAFNIEFSNITKNHEESSIVYYIYKTFSNYITALQTIYCICVDSVHELETNVFSIYQILSEIIENCRYDIDIILGLDNICEYTGEKLFKPSAYETKVNKPYINNQTRYEDGKQQNLSNELIMLSFSMPCNNTPSKYKFAWDSISNTDNMVILKQRIEILSFFECFLSGISLTLLLKSKIKTQKTYASLLDLESLKQYCKIMATELVGQNSSTIPLEDRAEFQKYSATLMEHLEVEISRRTALRTVQPNLF